MKQLILLLLVALSISSQELDSLPFNMEDFTFNPEVVAGDTTRIEMDEYIVTDGVIQALGEPEIRIGQTYIGWGGTLIVIDILGDVVYLVHYCKQGEFRPLVHINVMKEMIIQDIIWIHMLEI